MLFKAINRYRALALACGMAVLAVAGCSDNTTPAQMNPPSKSVPSVVSPQLNAPGQAELEAMFEAYGTPEISREVAKAHIVTFYRWINDRALAGKMVNPQLMLLCAHIALGEYFDKLPAKRAQVYLDALYLSTLTYRTTDDHPGVFGELEGRIVGPNLVDTHITIEQTYTVGTLPMAKGAGFIIPNHFRHAANEYQTEHPGAENYVSIISSQTNVRFENLGYPTSGQFASSLRGTNMRTFFKISAGELQQGDTVTIIIGDKSGGGPGLRSPHWTNDAVRFPVWVLAKNAGGELLMGTPPEVPFELLGLEAVKVKGFAPATVAVGDEVKVTIRAEDKFRNRAASGWPSAYEISLNGTSWKIIKANPDSAITAFTTSFDDPGIKRFSIASTDGRLQGVTDPILVEENPSQHIYFGETHGHSGFAEGQGTVDGYFRFARDEARLDFTVLSEHDLWMDAAEWQALGEGVRKYNELGVFTTFYGYEWSVEPPWGGHHNVVYRNPDSAVYIPLQLYPTLIDLWQGLKAHNDIDDVIAIPHAHQPGKWTMSDHDLERLVEVVSYHGTFEWFAQRYLNNGFEVGLIASSDDHIGHPGYIAATKSGNGGDNFGGMAAVYAPENSRDAIFDAMRNRHTYGTNGARIILKATMDGARMGTRLPLDADRKINGEVYGTAPIESITLVKNGEDYRVKDYALARGQTDIVEIAMQNSSDPVELRRVRKARVFSGEISINGGVITGIRAPVVEALNVHSEGVEQLDNQRVSFKLKSQGRLNTVELELADLKANATISIRGELTGKQVHKIPVQRFQLSTLAEGAYDRALTIGMAQTRFRARFIERPTELDRSFVFEDKVEAKAGDYYYLRVRQVDGGLAFSSPFWIGEPRPNDKATLQ